MNKAYFMTHRKDDIDLLNEMHVYFGFRMWFNSHSHCSSDNGKQLYFTKFNPNRLAMPTFGWDL